MEIKLQTTNIKHLDIEGNKYDCDCNSLKAMESIDSFEKKYREGQITFDQQLLDDCKAVIDTVLGEKAWNELFGDSVTSLAPYYLVLNLNRIYASEFMKEEKAKQEEESKKAMEEAKGFIDSVKDFSKTVDYAQKKYGGYNAMANKRRPSKKRKY